MIRNEELNRVGSRILGTFFQYSVVWVSQLAWSRLLELRIRSVESPSVSLPKVLKKLQHWLSWNISEWILLPSGNCELSEWSERLSQRHLLSDVRQLQGVSGGLLPLSNWLEGPVDLRFLLLELTEQLDTSSHRQRQWHGSQEDNVL